MFEIDRLRIRGSWRRGCLTALLVGLLIALPTASLAEPQYSMERKAGRGAAALFLGFLEIPGRITVETRKNGPIRGATVGLVQGVGMLIVRSSVGLFELFTVPAPLPSDFGPIIEPEFPWDYFTEDPANRGPTHDADVYETY